MCFEYDVGPMVFSPRFVAVTLIAIKTHSENTEKKKSFRELTQLRIFYLYVNVARNTRLEYRLHGKPVEKFRIIFQTTRILRVKSNRCTRRVKLYKEKRETFENFKEVYRPY